MPRPKNIALTRELLAIVTRRALDLTRMGAMAPLLYLDDWRRPPSRLELAPRALRIGDPARALEIYDGFLRLAGRELATHGRSPFVLSPPSEDWALELYGFDWLRHLRAAGTALAAAHARALVLEYLSLPPRRAALSLEATARRVLSLLAEAPMLLNGASAQKHRLLLRALGKDVARLRRAGDIAWPGQTRLTAAIAATSFALCVDGGKPLLKPAARRLEKQLAAQFLPDGAPIDRNPDTLVEALYDLLPLRELFQARGLAPPPELIKAIDRMRPALRLFQHGDGALALFNGAGARDPASFDFLLDKAEPDARPLINARYGGYQRLEAGEALALIEAGPPPPPEFSSRAHAGCLSFEYSLGDERIIVNCGDPGPRAPQARASARLSAAHSTLTLGDCSPNRFLGLFGPRRLLLGGPKNTPVAREDGRSVTVVASHDGYVASFGFYHERRLRLWRENLQLDGLDRLLPVEGAQPRDFAIRFHLHPEVTVELAPDAAAATLALPSGRFLCFLCEGAALSVEDSVFFAAPGGPQPCLQLVLRGVAPAEGCEIAWSLTTLV